MSGICITERNHISTWSLDQHLAAKQEDSESSTLKMMAICSSETSVLTITPQRHYIPEESIIYCYRCDNTKSYIVVLCRRLITLTKQRHISCISTVTDTTMEIPLQEVPFPSVVRYIPAANQKDSESFSPEVEAIPSSETSVLTRTTWRHHISEDSILHIPTCWFD
jgi:hypothetical protein